MPSLILKIEDADAKLLSELASAAELKIVMDRVDTTTRKISEGADMIVATDRTRAIEQIKRLYSVIVGFATITFLSGAVFCIRNMDGQNPGEAYGILISQATCFFTLLVLFVFGAERLLDLRYLQVTSAVPSWKALFGDVACVLFTASWFAVLANLLPVAKGAPPLVQLTDLEESQKLFVHALLAIYLIDIAILWIQGRAFKKRSGQLNDHDELATEQKNWEEIHGTWRRINVGMCIVMVLVAAYLNAREIAAYLNVPAPAIYINGVSAILFLAHALRFVVDVSRTFAFYYPQKRLSTQPT